MFTKIPLQPTSPNVLVHPTAVELRQFWFATHVVAVQAAVASAPQKNDARKKRIAGIDFNPNILN